MSCLLACLCVYGWLVGLPVHFLFNAAGAQLLLTLLASFWPRPALSFNPCCMRMLLDACCLCMLLVACRRTRLLKPALVTIAWLMRPAQAWSRCVFRSLHSINFMSMLVLAGTFLCNAAAAVTRCLRMTVCVHTVYPAVTLLPAPLAAVHVVCIKLMHALWRAWCWLS